MSNFIPRLGLRTVGRAMNNDNNKEDPLERIMWCKLNFKGVSKDNGRFEAWVKRTKWKGWCAGGDVTTT
jgi:hypothetical protein